MLKYTLAFIICNNEVLLLKRAKNPFLGLLNGVGGKIEDGEDKHDAIVREIHEETNIVISKEDCLYRGRILFSTTDLDTNNGGYIYIANIKSKPYENYECDEGSLTFYNIDEIINASNDVIVGSVIPKLKEILNSDKEFLITCDWIEDTYDIENITISFEFKN